MSLKIILDLLNDLNSTQINYCHWKSNEHLGASLNGDTDLDILFDEKDKVNVEKIMMKNNFHLFEAIWYKKYNDIVDYIGLDYEKGKIVHVHTHYKLDLGEVGIKSYNLPWEKNILNTKVYNHEYNIYTSDPIIEYILLVVRTSLKYDFINPRSNRRVVVDFNKEAKWLYSQIEIQELFKRAENLLGSEMASLIEKIRLNEAYDKNLFLLLRKKIKTFFAKYRVVTSGTVMYLKFIHIFSSIKKRAFRILKIESNQKRRTLIGKGLIISFLGSDGAGKSTQTKLVTKELAKKVDVLFMYMGSGKGNKSFQRKIVDSIFNLGLNYKNSQTNNKPNQQINSKVSETDISKKNVLTQYVLSVKAISLAFERKRRLKRIEKERARGGIVICDRYPQTFSLGHNDGMKLYTNRESSNYILRSFANYEFKCYDFSNEVFPDLIIKLVGNIDTLHSRRPEMTKKELEMKQNGIIELDFGKNINMVTLGIDQPKELIKTEILNMISSQIRERQI